MSRTKQTGPVFNNYVTFRLLARRATGSGQTAFVVDEFPMPAKFCVSGISFFGLGVTATTTHAVYDHSTSSLTVGSGVHPTIQALTNGTVNRLSTGSLKAKNQVGGGRIIQKGSFLQYAITTDGTGTVPAGGSGAWVTGYFMEPISRGKFAESGTSSGERPVAGYLDFLSLINLRANANQGAMREECGIGVPYDCRVQAIYFDARNITSTTGSSFGDVRKNDSSLLTANLDIDAGQNQQFRIDFDSTPTFVSSALRDFVRGDKLSLYLSTGVSDVIPIASVDAHVLVWVKSHVRDVNVAADIAVGVED
jgi:hypothetical protein